MLDWMTWGIWAVGFLILVVWIIVPIREFKDMLKRLRGRKE